MEVYPEKMDGTSRHLRSARCVVYSLFSRYTSFVRQLEQLFLIIQFETHYKSLKLSLTLMLLTSLLLTLPTTYLRLGGSTRVIQKLMQCRQYHDKKGIPSQTDCFASSNYSSSICTSNSNKSDLHRKCTKSSVLNIP